jgi:uncharacterized protein YbjT (DUF2867 family)
MPSPIIKNVMVLGASGSVGPPIVESLLAAGFTVSALTRASSKATFPDRVNVVRTDYSHESLVKAFTGQDVVVSTIATFSTDQQIKIVDAAMAAKVQRFLPSEFGIDTSSPQIFEALPPAKAKHDTVAYLKSKESTGLTWTAVIVGSFFDWGLPIGALGYNLPAKTATVFDGGNKPYEATNLAQIGRAVAAILSPGHFEETSNQYVYINSFTVTQTSVVEALETATGCKFDVTHVRGEEMWEEGKKKMSTGKFEETGGGQYMVGSVQMIQAEIYNRTGFNHFSESKGLWNRRLGLPKESLDETIRRVMSQVGTLRK